ncbi:DUF5977 domain-containing protein [Parapedobacter sp. GCM10030251]|uniref:DUF5977 domain-containing protein n=1 Tax=Parapedobacter sp. GCM10030251 TaxID=3273419 RepID=UPI0036083615
MVKSILPVLLFLTAGGLSGNDGPLQHTVPIQEVVSVDEGDPNNLAAFWPQVLPPSPTAALMGNYGFTLPNLLTGAPGIQIPLFAYGTKNLTLDISLSYHNQGLKVDQVASRVGLGWTLNAGGVINRTVYGRPDDGNFATIPPGFPGTSGQPLRDFMNSVINGLETEPDIFSYNFAGFSGRFIIKNQTIVKLEENNLKISGNLNGFEIVTDDGVIYRFNAIESSITMTGSTFYDKASIKNAWFLTSVTHPFGDEIYLKYGNCDYNYLASVNQIFTSNPSVSEPCGGSSTPCQDFPDFLENGVRIRNYGVYLTQISSNKRKAGVLKFNYTPREDVPGDVKLISIQKFDAKGNQLGNVTYYRESPVNSVMLGYHTATSTGGYSGYLSTDPSVTKRIFLQGIYQDGKEYSFTYDGLNQLPPRLSFSQDHYGYFNGKSNQKLIPKVNHAAIGQFNSYGFGNRLPDWNYSRKGQLTKIIYPTGGFDSLVYEANSVYVNDPPDCDNPAYSTSVYVEGSSELHETKTYHTGPVETVCAQLVRLNVGCIASYSTLPPSNYYVRVGLAAASNPVYTTVLKDILGHDVVARMNESNTFDVLLPAGSHAIVIQVMGPISKGSATFTYNNSVATEGNKEVGGVRIAKVVTADPYDAKVHVRRFYYNDLTSGRSTGVLQKANIQYSASFNAFQQCPGSASGCFRTVCSYTRFYSSDVYGLFDMSGNHIRYQKVTEGIGENFENGGVEHQYTVVPDGYPAVLQGNPIQSAPLSNTGIHSGKETNTREFIIRNNEQVTVKNTKYTYKIDPTKNTSQTFYSFRQDAGFTLCSQANYLSDYLGIDATSYNLHSRWMYQDSVITTLYDDQGLNPVTTSVISRYANPAHMLKTSEQSITSAGKPIKTDYKYPGDMVTAGRDPNGIYQGMVNKHMIGKLIETTTSHNSVQTGLQRTNYYAPHAGVYVPRSVETQKTISQAAELRIDMPRYDNMGNLQSVSRQSGPAESYLWGYDGQLPIAKVQNAGYAAVESILGAAAVKTMRDNANPTAEAILSFLEPLRTGLPNALLSIYVYDPTAGLIRETDPSGKDIFYAYDMFQRLSNIRDLNGHLLVDYEYHYGTPPPLYLSAQKSRNFTRNNCPSGQTGGVYTYTVPAGKYISKVSQADADNQAISEINLNGQQAANANAECSSISCGSVDKKWINGVCETGVKHYTLSLRRIGTNIYDCEYHYKWSDGSVSETFSELGHVGPCPID